MNRPQWLLWFLGGGLWLLLGCAPAGPTALTLPPETSPPAAVQPYLDAARQAAATLREVPVTDVRFQHAEPMTWPDTCLGVYTLDETCSPGPVAGYRLTLLTPQGPVWVHVAPAAVRAYRAILFRRSGTLAGLCLELTVLPDRAYWLNDFCRHERLRSGRLPDAAWAPLAAALRTYAPFRHVRQVPPAAYDAAEDQLACNGWGHQTASPEERDALADHLARWVMQLQVESGP